jgi:uroporphyrinogen decarboxylase
MLTKEQRVLRVIERRDVDYLPSAIWFTDNTRHQEIAESLGLDSGEELDDYLQNHLGLTFVADDLPIFYRNDDEYMLDLQERGFAYVDLENEMVYDRFGMGTVMHTDTFQYGYCLLEGNKDKNRKAAKVLPAAYTELMDLPLDQAIRKYQAPDPVKEGNLDLMERDLESNHGRHFIIPTGYFGIFERAYSIVGFEQFMMEIVSRPKMIHELMEKITEQRIGLAREKMKLGFSVHHHGDDLGTQTSMFISPKMFKEMILPYLKKLFRMYRDGGCHVCLHSCGYIIPFLRDLVDCGVNIIEPVQPCNDLGKLKREFGKDLVFWGGIDVQALPFLSPEETRVMVRDTIHTLGKGGGMIITPSQHITCDVPISNIKALVETIMAERSRVLEL